jgi:hypothetical protein
MARSLVVEISVAATMGVIQDKAAGKRAPWSNRRQPWLAARL